MSTAAMDPPSSSEALYVLPEGTTMKQYTLVGRTLATNREFAAGVVVFSDTPVLEWDPTDDLPEDVEALRTAPCDLCEATKASPIVVTVSQDGENSNEKAEEEVKTIVPHTLAAAAVAYAKAPTKVKKVILDMHVPELPVGEATWRLVSFGKAMSEMHLKECCPSSCEEEHVLSSESFIHAMLAAKVNSHRGPKGTWRLFAIASKLAHSCDPNTMYMQDRACFVSIRPIAAGEMLSFSYLGGNLLAQCTANRQLRLKNSHMFICQCARCRGIDYCRQLPCPARSVGGGGEDGDERCSGFIVRKSSPYLILDGDAFPDKVWSCDVGDDDHTYTDEELDDPTTIAAAGGGSSDGASLLQMESTLCEGINKLASSSTTLKYKELKAVLQLVMNKLGTRHWAYGEVCHRMMLYFKVMTQHGCPEGRHMVVGWGLKYLQHLQQVGIYTFPPPKAKKTKKNSQHHQDPEEEPKNTTTVGQDQPFMHMLCGAAIITIVDACHDQQSYQPLSELLAAAAAPLVIALYGTEDLRAQTLLSVAKRRKADAPPLTMASMLAAIPNTIAVPPKGLLALWDRIVALTVLRQMVNDNSGVVPSAQTPGLSHAGSAASVGERSSADSLDHLAPDPQ